PHLGGMENCVKEISKETVKNEYKVNVFTSTIGVKNNKEKSIKNFSIHYLKSLEIAHTPIIFSLFFNLLKLPKQSVIHLHIAHALTPEIVFVVSKIRKIPYIAHIHLDVDPSGPMGFLLKPYKNYFLKPVLHNATKIICLSELQKKVIAKKYTIPNSKIVVIPNGVGNEYFFNRKINAKKEPTILFVGRLAPQKNLLTLIKAMAHLKSTCKLQIVGEGEERDKISKLINKLHLSHITLLGKKTGKDLIQLYKNADIFVLPSIKEGVPLSLLEAMAAGLPIVASDIDGVNEIIGKSGYLVKNPSPNTFGYALEYVLSNTVLQKKLSFAVFNKAKLYHWEKVTKNIINQYNDIYK
ncbi:MAG TPA: glycosyltransferase family 4 protein, partial [Verrucomicrobiae bacterium]|nr:glycosyltransferase family 4 protein [Verrucomicrobiae bacterium]